MRRQLFIGFLIPILFVIIVGIYSYNKASDGMLQNYEKSTLETLQMTSEYLDFVFQGVCADSLQFSKDKEITNYVFGVYKEDAFVQKTTYDTIKLQATVKATSNEFVSNIHFITADGINCISTSSATDEKVNGFYKEFLEANEEELGGYSKKDKWLSTHALLDEELGIMSEVYALSQVRLLSSNNAFLVIDVSKDKIQSLLDNMQFGTGTKLSFITADGREIQATESDYQFVDKSHYADILESEETGGFQYVTNEGKEYLYVWSKCQANSSVICALIPKTLATSKALEIKKAVYIIVAIACLVVLITGSIIIYGISKHMKYLVTRLAKVAQGDLTIEMKINKKNEFGELAKHISNMIASTKHLVSGIITTVDAVTNSGEEVSEAAQVLSQASENIQSVTVEIDAGINQQAVDAERCLTKMDELSTLILGVDESIQQMSRYASSTGEMIQKGSESMNELTGQTRISEEMTETVCSNISILAERIQEIERFVSTINEIAEATTLLSLNASIEAARVGEAGKGFAVVAGEIKKLADNSLKASEEIQVVVGSISNMAKTTIESSEKASGVALKQKSIVENTTSTFDSMSGSITNLLENIEVIRNEMNEMSGYRGKTLSSIESISSVLEQTAASTTVVNETTDQQMGKVVEMLEATQQLNDNIVELEKMIKTFTI
ncbi:methyl-accepting chemotaxis protein [Anaerosporobacter sp.]|uniref:methyl-accepting chemotaxis protein n=1 Tax=Anaerosporobacter sp. TaxID=1872529 RepID=UPI00286FA695|nr:methyl-accepting chemotaxis protein [Anaerosporobacter sp.]